jgi:hypothetical protein
MKNQILSIKDAVVNVLSDDERCRNSDKWCVIKTLRFMGYRIDIPYDDLKDMPSFESIRRCRQKIQEEGYFEPTDPEVKEAREAHRKDMEDINKWW